MDTADTYYRDALPPSPPRSALSGTVEADVAILGGGLAGISAALHLAERGRRVVVVEARQVGFGASGRNGGQVLAGYSAGLDGIARRNGMAAAKALWDESVAAVDLVRDLAARHAIACDLQDGAATVAVKPRHLSGFHTEQRWLADEFGYGGLEVWDGPQTAAIVRSPRYCGGLYDPRALHLNPLALVRGMADAATGRGAVIFEDSPAIRIDRNGPVKRIITAGGQVEAKSLILAANAYIDGLEPWAARRIMPVSSCVIATEPLGPLLAECLTRPIAVCDANIVLDYFRPTGDGRLLFGGLANYSGLPPRDIRATLRARLVTVFPQLKSAKVSHGWSGLIDISLTREPLIGAIAPDIYLAQGFSGHGVALACLAGLRLAEGLCGDDTALAVYDRLKRPVFPGGPLRTLGLVLGMAYLRLKDRFA